MSPQKSGKKLTPSDKKVCKNSRVRNKFFIVVAIFVPISPTLAFKRPFPHKDSNPSILTERQPSGTQLDWAQSARVAMDLTLGFQIPLCEIVSEAKGIFCCDDSSPRQLLKSSNCNGDLNKNSLAIRDIGLGAQKLSNSAKDVQRHLDRGLVVSVSLTNSQTGQSKQVLLIPDEESKRSGLFKTYDPDQLKGVRGILVNPLAGSDTIGSFGWEVEGIWGVDNLLGAEDLSYQEEKTCNELTKIFKDKSLDRKSLITKVRSQILNLENKKALVIAHEGAESEIASQIEKSFSPCTLTCATGKVEIFREFTKSADSVSAAEQNLKDLEELSKQSQSHLCTWKDDAVGTNETYINEAIKNGNLHLSQAMLKKLGNEKNLLDSENKPPLLSALECIGFSNGDLEKAERCLTLLNSIANQKGLTHTWKKNVSQSRSQKPQPESISEYFLRNAALASDKDTQENFLSALKILKPLMQLEKMASGTSTLHSSHENLKLQFNRLMENPTFKDRFDYFKRIEESLWGLNSDSETTQNPAHQSDL